MKSLTINILTFLSLSALVFSCKKDKAEDPVVTPAPSSGYNVPATYSFSPMSYSGQTTRLDMMTEMKTEMAKGNTSGTVVSAVTLKNMFSNTGSPFINAALNTSGKQLKSKCFSLDQPVFESFMDSLAANSSGTGSVVVSTSNPSKKYLQSVTGREYSQIIEKGLMGAVLYYQSMETYICAAGVGASVDNTTSVANEGTAMEHHWDEGFGYLGVPTAFPDSTVGVRYWGKYCNDMKNTLANAGTLMSAFKKGRAAISNKDYTTRDAQMAIVRAEWEKLVAASAIREFNLAKANISDDALRNHYLSEAFGFVMSLKYKSDKLITDAQITTILTNYLGGSFYTISQAQIDNAINDISTVYGLDAIKASL